MAEKHLIAAIGEKYDAMSRRKRIKIIQSLDSDGIKFIKKFFPRFYAEAYPQVSRSASGSWESDSRPAQYAKSR